MSVAVMNVRGTYPSKAPYSPAYRYPEYPFEDIAERANPVYPGIRYLLYQLAMDRRNFGSADWNPFGGIIRPGMTVVIKPNFVKDQHAGGEDVFSMITHPSVLRPIIDYVLIALKGSGIVIVADAPHYDCDWDHLMSLGFGELQEFYRKIPSAHVYFQDLREYWSRSRHFDSQLEGRPGDPRGSIHVNLGNRSALFGVESGRFHGSTHCRIPTNSYHMSHIQRYDVSKTVMDADVVISVPKLKVHKKVGVSLGCKGLVGICTEKNFLVHYRLGPPSEGGDQYPEDNFTPVEQCLIDLERWMYDHLLSPGFIPAEYLHRFTYWLHNHTTRKLGIKVREDRRMLDAGNWYGNDTCWRMVYDLMLIWHYHDRNGNFSQLQPHRTFTIIDGVTGGDLNGPLAPRPRHSRALIGGARMLEVDLVAARLMGFDISKIPMYNEMLRPKPYLGRSFGLVTFDPSCISVCSNVPDWARCMKNKRATYLDYIPHPGWQGHIEIGGRHEEGPGNRCRGVHRNASGT